MDFSEKIQALSDFDLDNLCRDIIKYEKSPTIPEDSLIRKFILSEVKESESMFLLHVLAVSHNVLLEKVKREEKKAKFTRATFHEDTGTLILESDIKIDCDGKITPITFSAHVGNPGCARHVMVSMGLIYNVELEIE